MQRNFPTQSLDWTEKTMSMVMSAQLEQCERRLKGRAPLYLFGGCTDLQAEILWKSSYDALERPYEPVLHTIQSMQDNFVETLPYQIPLLTFQEVSLITVLLDCNGYTELTQDADLLPAESLCRRLICYIDSSTPNTLTLKIPETIQNMICSVGFADLQQDLYDALESFESNVHRLLYMEGMCDESILMQAMQKLIAGDLLNQETFIHRYLHAAFDWIPLANGHTMIIHPGAVQTETMLQHHKNIAAKDLAYFTERKNSDSENDAAWLLHGLLNGATRPEKISEALVWDLLLMAKQNASLEDMSRVLTEALMLDPTRNQLEALHVLRSQVAPWHSCITEETGLWQ